MVICYYELYKKFGTTVGANTLNEQKETLDSDFIISSHYGSFGFDVKGGSPTLGEWKSWLKSIPEDPAVIYQVKLPFLIFNK